MSCCCTVLIISLQLNGCQFFHLLCLLVRVQHRWGLVLEVNTYRREGMRMLSIYREWNHAADTCGLFAAVSLTLQVKSRYAHGEGRKEFRCCTEIIH